MLILIIIYFMLVNFLQLTMEKTEIKNCQERMKLTYSSDEIAVYIASGKRRNFVKNCILEINTVMPMNFLRLVFSEFNIDDTMPDCATNSLEILVGCNPVSIGLFCGKKGSAMPHKIYSYDHCMTLIFHMSYGRREIIQGFTAEYDSIGHMSGVTLPFEQIENPVFRNLSNDVFFSFAWPFKYPTKKRFQQNWLIDIKDGSAIKISFMDFRLPLAANTKYCSVKGMDVLIITGDSDDPELYCGTKEPFYVIFRSLKRLEITFKVNGDDLVDRGFILGYVQFPDFTVRHEPVTVLIRWILIALFVLEGVFVSLVVFLVSLSKKTPKKYNARRERRESPNATILITE